MHLAFGFGECGSFRVTDGLPEIFDDAVMILADLSPHNPAVAVETALQLLDAGQTGHCMRALDLAIGDWPEDQRGWRLRARLHLAAGRLAEGTADHARAMWTWRYAKGAGGVDRAREKGRGNFADIEAEIAEGIEVFAQQVLPDQQQSEKVRDFFKA